ncbi:MAG: site-specific DNA-methyltransferase [Tissierellia bacterium]|nr:site-specific DNA-methyltransferase [Patescibacteria group bacterium]MDD4677739.1 site-specific DNA-methyltransferase [Tissierellia bacterium]
MEKLRMETTDITDKNIKKIAALFPNVITEMKDEKGKLKKGIKFELLKQELSGDVIDGEECYDFTWVGKKAAIVESNTPIRKTLRPCIEESKDWENTENLYIEGDNLEVLKLLQESYLNSIKMIYIDPPYNTGNDFIYKDNFKIDKDEYEEQIGLYDEEDNRMFKNTDTNGRFHSDWCSMMYPRLKLALNLLSEDGVIFISIDDNEVENLKKICNEVFGETNFISSIIWEKKYGIQNDAKYFSVSHDYILVYAKNKPLFTPNLLPRTEQQDERYKNPDNDYRGVWKSADLSVGRMTDKDRYVIITPSGRKVLPPEGRSWVVSKEKLNEMIKDNRIWFGQTGNNVPSVKKFLTEVQNGLTPKTIWNYSEVGHTDKANKELKDIFNNVYFDYPKPIDLIKRIIHLCSSNSNDFFVLDFFSGSGTTAHASMQLNAEDGGKRKFIIVQLPEETDEKGAANKAGYKNICEIGKERIRRAGEKIKSETEKNNKKLKDGEEPKKVPDIGFRVLKVDSTNMKDVYYSASEYKQEMIEDLESNIKEDRTDLDLLYGVMLDWGLPLSLKHKIKKIECTTIHIVDNGSLIACFENKVSESVIREIANLKPLRVVFRDSCFDGSPEKINVEEIFKLLSPNTGVRVI